jgi:hypothetical protein
MSKKDSGKGPKTDTPLPDADHGDLEKIPTDGGSKKGK